MSEGLYIFLFGFGVLMKQQSILFYDKKARIKMKGVETNTERRSFGSTRSVWK
jgi:hypothetical protein